MVPWHLPSAHTGPRDPARGPCGSPNGPWNLNSDHKGPSELVQVPRGSPNSIWQIPSAYTGPGEFVRVPSVSPNATWLIPQHGHGAQRPRTGSQWLAEWSLAHQQRAHGAK
ncbi:UNVERIFIED_CONTAM: hypothetical protein FKN15_065744 [Acipenser sinensis]